MKRREGQPRVCPSPRQSDSKHRRFASVAEPRDAINQRARLARPGAGNDQQWTIAMSHGGELRSVQDLGVLDPEVRVVGRLRGRPRVL
jgi:hypothetical protein